MTGSGKKENSNSNFNNHLDMTEKNILNFAFNKNIPTDLMDFGAHPEDSRIIPNDLTVKLNL